MVLQSDLNLTPWSVKSVIHLHALYLGISHVRTMFVWASSWFTDFLPPSKNMLIDVLIPLLMIAWMCVCMHGAQVLNWCPICIVLGVTEIVSRSYMM